MERRSFLKNSLFALFGAAISSNSVLSEVAQTLSSTSPKVLLYLIQLTTGEWKIRATKWVDLPKKRLTEKNIIKDSFKPIDIVDINQVVDKRFKYWKEYNCSGRMGSLVSLGISMTDEMKKEYGDFNTKRHKGVKRSDQVRNNIKVACIGRPSPRKGKTHTVESKEKMSQSAKIKIFTEEHRNNIGKSVSGHKNPFYGKKHTQESLQVINDKHPSKIKVTCEHCNQELDLPNYKRSHGDKCKLSNIDKYNEKFLLSDQSIAIINLLENNIKYKDITKITGYSKNTIIKTNKIYKSVFA